MSFTGPGNYTEIEEEIEVTFRNQKFTIKHRCYCNEKGEKFTTNRQDDDMMWAVFRAYWERRGFEYFYDIDGYKEKQKPAIEDLEQAARDYRDKTEFQYPNQLQPAYEGFKAGAEWMAKRFSKLYAEKFLSMQVQEPIPESIQKVIDDHFWEKL